MNLAQVIYWLWIGFDKKVPLNYYLFANCTLCYTDQLSPYWILTESIKWFMVSQSCFKFLILATLAIIDTTTNATGLFGSKQKSADRTFVLRRRGSTRQKVLQRDKLRQFGYEWHSIGSRKDVWRSSSLSVIIIQSYWSHCVICSQQGELYDSAGVKFLVLSPMLSA